MKSIVSPIFSQYYTKQTLNIDSRFCDDIEKNMERLSVLLILRFNFKREIYIHYGTSLTFDFHMDNKNQSLLLFFNFLCSHKEKPNQLYFDRFSVSSKNIIDLKKIQIIKNNSGFYMQNQDCLATYSAEAALETIDQLIKIC